MSGFDIDLTRQGPRQAPLEVAPDTFMIRALTSSTGGTWTNLNSMVIRAEQPVVVDTGMAAHRKTWFDDVFSLVPPEEVRWIFVTHIDGDHAGNLVEVLDRCPKASVVTSLAESYRTSACLGISPDRMRMVDDGQTFHVGDRTLRAVRPPVYDSPYTRGLFDPSTRVYYAADAFCAPMPERPVDWVDEIPPRLWEEGMARFQQTSVCPWITLVDQTLFKAEVDRLASLDVGVIVGAHTPGIRGAAVTCALEHLAALPSRLKPAGALRLTRLPHSRS